MRRTRLACDLVALLGLFLLPVNPMAVLPAAAAAPKALPPIAAIPGHFAVGHGPSVEVPRLRTRFSHTVANGDGTYTTTYTLGAQNCQDAKGQW